MSLLKDLKEKNLFFNYKTREKMLYQSGLVDLVVENEKGEDSKPIFLKIPLDNFFFICYSIM